MQQGTHLWRRARRQFEGWSWFYGSRLAQWALFERSHTFLCRRLPRRPGLKVLEIACGSGHLLAMLPKYLPKVQRTGLDLAGNMLRRARQVLGPHANLTQADSRRLPFASNQFDVVLCAHSFHHFPDQAGTLREIQRVLRDGGLACVLDGDPDDFFGWLWYEVLIRWWEGPVHHASAQEMRQLFAQAGFGHIQQDRQGAFPPVLLTRGCAEKPRDCGGP